MTRSTAAVMVFNFPLLFLFFPLKSPVPPLITPFTPVRDTVWYYYCATMSVCVRAYVCLCAVGGRYLSIVAILQDTKLGVVMSVVMSSCQGNRSMPLAQRSDRWDGIDLCEPGQDKAASLSSFPLALSLSEELPVNLTSVCSRTLSFLSSQTKTALLSFVAICRVFLSLPLPHTHTHTHTGLNDVRCQWMGLAAPVHSGSEWGRPLLTCLSSPFLVSFFSLLVFFSKGKLDSVHVHNEEM